MSRPRSYTVAVVLLALNSLMSVVFELPNLFPGAAPAADAPPFAVSLAYVTLGILGFIAAFGVWRMQKWGVPMAVAVCALSILSTLPPIFFVPSPVLRAISVISVLWLAAIIALLIRPLGIMEHPSHAGNARGGQSPVSGSD